MSQSITIIGAGIGGLTTALVLRQRGIDVTVYESSAEIKPVGAGIILANNAMQVFQKLGLQNKLSEAGNRISCMKITDSQLKPLSVVDLSDYERKYKVHNLAIHRGELQTILANEIGFEHIQLSKRLTQIEKASAFKLTFDDDTVVERNVVIGADGIRSVVRNQLFKENTLRHARQKCWRGVCNLELPRQYHHELNEAWGKGKRFGFVRISATKVYWYGLTNDHVSYEADLAETFNDFHPDILTIIRATPRNQLIRSDILDLKPIDKWQNGTVCLIGDAAHATTPNLGQGACQAIEDAYVIGQLLDRGLPIDKVFSQYETKRKRKAHTIVNTSWNLGKLAHIDNDAGVWVRNNVMRLVPKAANKKQMDMIFDLT